MGGGNYEQGITAADHCTIGTILQLRNRLQHGPFCYGNHIATDGNVI